MADSETTMVKIEIDGIAIEAPQGSMVIEAADRAGIKIPRFCYHKKLSVAANCRMCLVECEKAPKPMPACATPVMDGMVVHTRSPNAIAAQKSVMEFLLINHPLDCPICDQGGECELQDVAVAYGSDASQYHEEKRVVPSPNLGALISTDMTRCIHCTRCVRFGEEIAGMREMGATGRGEHTKVGTYISRTVDSELSGNVIDLCPVGALTSRPFRYKARSWELRQYPSVAPHDALGANINLHVRNDRILRVVPRENEALNEVWLSDRDRFSYEGIYSDDRLTTPRIKERGRWRDADWQEALAAAVKGLQKAGAESLNGLISPHATCEELYLTQKLVRGLGSNNIDHRLRQVDFSDQDLAPVFPALGTEIEELESVDVALLIGTNLRKDHPLINVRLRKAASSGAKIGVVNPIRFEFNYPLAAELISAPQEQVATLAGVAREVSTGSGQALPEQLHSLTANGASGDAIKQMAQSLIDGNNGTVVLGALAAAHPDFSALRGLATFIAAASGARLGYLPEAANSAGAWLCGAIPHRTAAGGVGSQGLDAAEMMFQRGKGYLLVAVEPDRDFADCYGAQETLTEADCVVALSSYTSSALEHCADILLPIAAFGETGGSLVNMVGQWQQFNGVVAPLGQSRPAWKVLRVLGNLFGLDGFDQTDLGEVQQELESIVQTKPAAPNATYMAVATKCRGELVRVGDLPALVSDPLVRRAAALQQTGDANCGQIRINPGVAARNGLTAADQAKVAQGDAWAVLPLQLDERVPDGAVWVSAGLAATAGMGASFGPISMAKV